MPGNGTFVLQLSKTWTPVRRLPQTARILEQEVSWMRREGSQLRGLFESRRNFPITFPFYVNIVSDSGILQRWKCMNCSQSGHGNWECPKPRGYSKMMCRRCEEKGHMSTECTNVSKWKCTNCEQNGHGHWECPKPREFDEKRSRLWRKIGHILSECPDRLCFRCGLKGHFSTTCTNPPRAKTICYRCGSLGPLDEALFSTEGSGKLA